MRQKKQGYSGYFIAKILLLYACEIGIKIRGVLTMDTWPVLFRPLTFDEGTKMVQDTEPELSLRRAVIINVDSIYNISPGPDTGEQIG
jgi:hypothetical protein